LFERAAARLEHGLRLRVAPKFVVDGLAVALLQLRLVVEQVELRRPAEHEEEDD